MENIFVYDVTLRDGEQAPGFTMNPKEKLLVAKQLAKLGVDGIEAGFAISSPGDEAAIYQIAKEVGNTKDSPIISSLARVVKGDIDAAVRAIEPAYNKRIHVFVGTSDEHIKHKFKKNNEWVLDKIAFGVSYAKQFVDDVEFSAEDFARTNTDFVIDSVIQAIKSGATTINLPDTVGIFDPNESYKKVKKVIDTVREKGYDAIFSIHNHNDLGMATANTVMGVKGGARQVEVTINGIGERAGNTSLEEVVASLHTKKIASTKINKIYIGETSKLISEITGVKVQPNKAIVGANAYAHEAGIHQDGVIKNASTYEIMDPKDYGMESIISFGPRSGRSALKSKYISLGYNLSAKDFEKSAKNFTSIADQVKEVDDADVIRSIYDCEVPNNLKFDSYHQTNSYGKFSTITNIFENKNHLQGIGNGNGSIDSGITAIRNVLGTSYSLIEYSVSANEHGSSAYGSTRLVLEHSGFKVIGKGKSKDVTTSAFEAYLDGVNRMDYCLKMKND